MAQTICVLGIAIATLVCHLVGRDDTGHVVLRKRMTRSEWPHCIAMLPPVLLGMEACGSTHYWARPFRAPGHEVRLIAPPFVRADVTSPKHDTRDAEAICEAVTRPTMRVVPIPQLAQQDLQTLHRVRARLIKARTAFVNALRGLLRAYGMVFPQGMTKFRTSIVRPLEDAQAKLTSLSTEVFWHLDAECVALEKRVAYEDEKRCVLARAHPVCQRVQASPGVGPLRATAILAAVPDAPPVKNGRPLAAWWGLIPGEHSTGGKPRLLGMSTRGDV
jgi:transposase